MGSPAGPAKAGAQPARLFNHWPRDRQPDLVLVLSGQQHGVVRVRSVEELLELVVALLYLHALSAGPPAPSTPAVWWTAFSARRLPAT